MKIIIVHVGDILLCPPIINLMKMLEKMKYDAVLISTKSTYYSYNLFDYVSFDVLNVCYEELSLLQKLYDLFYMKRMIWKKIRKYEEKHSIIWVSSLTSLKYLGNEILRHKYILQMMELTENLRIQRGLPFKFNATRVGNCALSVVVPEYNRAHITQAWWELKSIPMILSNKPFVDFQYEKYNKIENEYARDVIEGLRGKKIILYQGIIHKERPLDAYIEAVNRLGEDYAFVVLASGENIYKAVNSTNFYFIPRIDAPLHLQVTSHAFIGVLSYFPVKTGASILNALYCAPNKTYEYAMYGIPMIANDVPSLRYLFSVEKCGICVDQFDADGICSGIKFIENHYKELSENALAYFHKTDTEKELKKIIKNAETQL